MNSRFPIIASLVCVIVIGVIVNLLSVRGLPSELTISVDPIPYDARFELFVDFGEGLYKTSSVVSFGGASTQVIKFQLPSDSIRAIRIDPGSRAITMRIRGINFGSYHWDPAGILRDFKPENDISLFSPDSGSVLFTSVGEDPQIYSRLNFGEVYESLRIDADLEDERRKPILYLAGFAIAAMVYFYLGQGQFHKFIPNLLAGRLGSKYLLVFLFFGFLWAPIVESVLSLGPEPRILGKMVENNRPTLNARTMTKFPKMYEAYFNDHFGFRHSLIRLNSLTKLKILRTSPEKKVILGKDGWLFYDTDNYKGDGITIKDYRGLAPFSRKELTEIRDELIRRRDTLAKYGIQYVLAVAPNKNTIYADYLPDYITKIGLETRLDQLLKFMKGNSTMNIVDPRSVLREGRTTYPTYYMNNSHWNDYGALLAYGEIMKEVESQHQGIKIYGVPDFDLYLEARERGDIGDMLAIGDVLGDVNVGLRVRGQVDKKIIGKLVYLHDSFGDWLTWFLSLHFDPIVDLQTQHFFDVKRITSEKPAVVIHVIAERYLDRLGLN